MDWTAFGAIPVAILGAIIGSFLNVVIYRLPRGLSVHSPRWSFCPHCSRQISPQHNIPIFGWLLLGGRCAHCRAPISIIYPAIEAATALVFVMIWDAFFVARTLPVIHEFTHLWPLVLAYFFLFAALLASAAMDIESYTIHIQVLLGAMIIGVVAHGLAGLAPLISYDGILPPSVCLIAIAAGAVWLVTELSRRLTRRALHQPEQQEDTPAETAANPDEHAEHTVPVVRPFQPIPILLLTALLVGLAAWQSLAPGAGLHLRVPPWAQRAFVACCVLMTMLILSSLESREADEQIVVDLERERHEARSMVLHEFLTLLPAVLVGISLWLWLRQTGRIATTWTESVDYLGRLVPGPRYLAAAGRALAAAILAAATGWTVRILGTLAFRKEAFGTGDIYILAAIGAVCGLWLVCVSFLLAAVLALVGVLATSFRKKTRAIPFGPWLALGAFVGLWVEEPLVQYFRPLGWLAWSLFSGQHT
ncbi:MAG TPA: prepilin peptidase [Phycisphaerae bacterium]|nr:prepilin peptidase [Phycisphaerae bacterium]